MQNKFYNNNRNQIDSMDLIVFQLATIMITTLIINFIWFCNYRRLETNGQECYLIANKLYCEKKVLLKGCEE